MAREIASEAGEKEEKEKRKEEEEQKEVEGGPPATATFPQVVHLIAGGSRLELEKR